jgi:hypothetical protein
MGKAIISFIYLTVATFVLLHHEDGTEIILYLFFGAYILDNNVWKK